MIRVVAGDLARQAVDAVLRPADATLAPVGAAAVHLDAVGGAGFAAQRRTATLLEAGAAVVTGAGDLDASYVLHVVVADDRGPASRETIRRALVSAWERAAGWGLTRIATPLAGLAGTGLTLDECASLLVETATRGADAAGGLDLTIVVEPAERDAVEGIVRRLT